MKIAIASQNRKTVTGHAGMSRRFVVWEAADGGEPVEVERLDLPKEMAFHNFHGQGPHPLDVADVLIVASCGAGFAGRMAARGIRVVQTAETDPVKAVRDFLAGTLAPPDPNAQDHGHRAGHGHAH
jgi:predicted Fe-Mo cluster-binding NifX family protein